jgi:hypothetical protein
MAETLREYTAEWPVPHTLLLTAKDAEKYGAAVTLKVAAVPSNKAAFPTNK